MADIKNSIGTFLKQMLVLQKNQTEIFEKFSDVVTSSDEFVTFEITADNGDVDTIQVPSFGFIKKEIDRLEESQKSLSGLDESSSVIRLSDGSYKSVIINTLQREPSDIITLNTPTSFDIQTNWFFEEFLNPLLYISYDLTGQVPIEVKKLQVERYILNIENDIQLNYFNSSYNNRNDIDRDSFLEDLDNRGITYFVDEDVIDLPLKESIFYGTFDVIRIFDETQEVNDGEINFNRRVRNYRLNKLTYSSKDSSIEDTELLKVGDNIVTSRNLGNTRYRVTSVDESTNTVSLERIEGYESIPIGADVIEIYKPQDGFVEGRINIGFNERTVVFIKSIDPSSNRPAKNWSPGTAFYSNDLLITNENGTQLDLGTYYKNSVTDFGSLLIGMAKDQTPPSVLGVAPDPPELNEQNFKVVPINRHLTDKNSVAEIKKLNAQKISLKSEIDEKNEAVSRLRQKISTKNYRSNSERSSDIKDLEEREQELETKNNLYSSTIDRILSLSEDVDTTVDPKYRVRGFWPVPNSKPSQRTKDQEVIGFKYRFRYLSPEGDGNPTEQIEYTDTDGSSRTGSFSTWVERDTPIRNRTFNASIGEYEWDDINVEDGDEVNINQLDISIQKNEAVEIQVKSKSEAGYPNNPLTSNWSDPIIIEFPDDISLDQSVLDIIEQTRADDTRDTIRNELNSIGVEEHVQNSFTEQETYIAHPATEIASGFKSPEQTNITLFDKLKELDVNIRQLQEVLNNGQGQLSVKLLDPNGVETVISNNSETKVFAGYYKEEVEELTTVKKGAIITKQYFLILENVNAADLKLLSINPGGNVSFPSSSESYFEIDYSKRLYDKVPLLNQNPDESITPQDAPHNPEAQYQQSPQRAGQYLYLRYRDAKLVNSLYVDASSFSEADALYFGNTKNAGDPRDFIFNGTFTNGNPNGGGDPILPTDDIIAIHVNHPILQETQNVSEIYDSVRNSKLAGLTPADTDGTKQYSYRFFGGDNSIKTFFKPEDQFLIGPNSVGSYLNLITTDQEFLSVNGSTGLSTKTIEVGSNNSIKIPIIFQYRMTDYFGSGDSGLGNIGGDPNGTINNITYTKKLGFDLLTDQKNPFSFDLEFTAKYKPEGVNVSSIPTRSFETALGDITTLNPTLSNE